jgi:hypothetical protein
LGQPVLKYNTIYEGFLVKSEPASKKVGRLASPKITSHSRGAIAIV